MTSSMKRIRERRLKEKDRWEYRRSMYGNVVEIIDHERMIFYRQDKQVTLVGDLFDGHLPFYCDYCESTVDNIESVSYELTYEMLNWPNTPKEIWGKSNQVVKFACCNQCKKTNFPVPEGIIGYHVTMIKQDGKLVYTQDRKR
jgi:hypothetical protein